MLDTVSHTTREFPLEWCRITATAPDAALLIVKLVSGVLYRMKVPGLRIGWTALVGNWMIGLVENESDALDEEQLLVRNAMKGSKEARGALLARYEGLVRNYLRKRMGHRLVHHLPVEDLLHEVFLRGAKAMEKLKDGARGEDLARVLLQHARWVLADHGRQAGHLVRESDLAGSGDGEQVVLDRAMPTPSTGPVTMQDRQLWLHGLSKRLEPKYASVIDLYLQGKKHGQIAAELGINEETARKRFLRAVQQLRESMDDPGK